MWLRVSGCARRPVSGGRARKGPVSGHLASKLAAVRAPDVMYRLRRHLTSVAFVFDERVVLVVAVRREGGLRVEARRAVLERQTHLVQLRLDLVDRLGT